MLSKTCLVCTFTSPTGSAVTPQRLTVPLCTKLMIGITFDTRYVLHTLACPNALNGHFLVACSL
jgi:hypothetical protein